MSENYALTAFAELEADAIYALREAAAEFQRPALSRSGGNESACLQRLAEAAFAPGRAPFPDAAAGADALIEAGRANDAEVGPIWGLYPPGLQAGATVHLRPFADWT